MELKLQDIKDDHRVEVYTICLGRWRLLKDTGIVLEDVTFKSSPPDNKRLFAPPNFQLISDFKTGKISPCEYKEAYLNKMERSSKVYYNDWKQFLTRHDKIALGCYCSDPEKCHRTLLAAVLEDFGEENDIEVILMGEIEGEKKCLIS